MIQNLFDAIAFEPLMPLWALWSACAVAVLIIGLYALARGRAPVSRGLALLAGLAALSGPSLVREERQPLPSVAVILVDRSESMRLSQRTKGADAVAAALQERLRQEPNLDVRVATLSDGPEGTTASAALDQALADVPQERVAGAIIIGDGRLSDGADAARPFPVHQALIGNPNERDRRIIVKSAPRTAPVGEIARIIVQVEDTGPSARLAVHVGDEPEQVQEVATGQDIIIEVPVDRRGIIPVAIEAAEAPGEISTANNAVALQVSGVRDRLRVMLVTGEPYAGARAWRNLLKSDPSVDLVQFTILRPPEKQDFTPVEELSLIPFPTRELFLDKIDSFDLVVFDRFRRLVVLPDDYLESVAQWVENGGAFLTLAGPAESQSDGVHATPLARVVPTVPTGLDIEQPFRPSLTELGRTHPVSAGLVDQSQTWGQWLRVQASTPRGDVLLEGAGQPLLVLSQVGEGRAAALMSDQAWLWRRGYDGGGPFDEIFRRTAHWLMKEADLDADRLIVRSAAGKLLVERRSVTDPGPARVEVSGITSQMALLPAGPGLWRGEMAIETPGLHKVRSGERSAFVVAGIGNPVEAQSLTADPTALQAPQSKAGNGNAFWLGRDGQKALPSVRWLGGANRQSAQDLGLRRSNAFVVTATQRDALLPAWVYLLAMAGFSLLGWLREGR